MANMLLISGFTSDDAKTIVEALDFVTKRISSFYSTRKASVDRSHHNLIEEEYKKEVVLLEKIKASVKIHSDMKVYQIDEESYTTYMDVIRSALIAYLRDSAHAREKTGLSAFDSKINEIRRITDLEALRNRKNGLFDKYDQNLPTSVAGGKVEIFLSYSSADKTLAREIADLLKEKGIDPFLAHENIKISAEWRNEIVKHLASDNVLVALLTPRYKTSVYANQEAGYMMGKKGRIIPLIVDETKIKAFGFLESFQGIAVKSGNLKDCAEKIVGILSG